MMVDAWFFRDVNTVSARSNHEANNKLVVFSGTATKPSILMPLLLDAQRKCIFDVVAYPDRMPIRPRKLDEVTKWGNAKVRELKSTGKKVATFGYSMGGVIAHAVGEETHSPSLSLFTSAYDGDSFVGRCLERLRGSPLPTVTIPPQGRAIIPEYSLLAQGRDFGNSDDKVSVACGVDTHLGINHRKTRDLVQKLLEEIFKSQGNE